MLPPFFAGLGLFKYGALLTLAIVLMAAGSTTARIIGGVMLVLLVGPVAAHLARRGNRRLS